MYSLTHSRFSPRAGLAIVGAVALTLLVAPGAALAGRGKEPAVLVVQTKGTARDQDVAAEAVTQAVTSAGWTLSSRTFAPRELDELGKCPVADRPWACFSKTVRDATIRRLALLSLEAQTAPDGSPMTVVTVMVASAEQENVAYSGRRYCQACSPGSLSKLTTAAAREVLDKMYLDSGRTYLQVKSRPAGALVEVDGKPMGVTDASFEILPGKHRVDIKHPAYPPQTRWVEAAEDRTAIVTIAFDNAVAPTPTVPEDSTAREAAARKEAAREEARRRKEQEAHPPRPSLLVPKAVVAAGALLIAGGALAIVLDEDEPGKGPPLNESPSQSYRNTAPLGAGMLIAGAVVAGAGGWWWWRSSSTQPSKPQPSAALVVQPGSAAFTFSTTF